MSTNIDLSIGHNLRGDKRARVIQHDNRTAIQHDNTTAIQHDNKKTIQCDNNG